MTYEIVPRPPVPGSLWDMSKEEAKSFVEWFHEIMPGRISQMAQAVASTTGCEGWEADGTPDSLIPLGAWYAGQVETRDRTRKEMQEFAAGLGPKFSSSIGQHTRDLTQRTYSLTIDVGMYFGRVILENVPSTRWTYTTKDRRDVNYGQPIIVGNGKMPLNPVLISRNIAYGIVRGKGAPNELRRLFDVWRDTLQPQSESGSNIG